MLFQYIPKPGTTPFRNGFRSFLLALQFGLTLGCGGEDSANCPFSVAWMATHADSDSQVTIRNVEGMDVLFSIVEVSRISTENGLEMFSDTRYYVGDFYQDENPDEGKEEDIAQTLYKEGCDPITAHYLATRELPG